MPIEATPIIVPPSGNFQGNDGSWSSLNITVGTPPQSLEVFPATEIPEIWVVLPSGCTSTDPSNCTETRGGTFDNTKSSSWITKATYQLQAESNLGYTANSDNGNYGLDSVGVGKPGAGNVALDGQVVAGFLTKDFYLGNLGLAARPISFDSDNNPRPSFLSSLQNKDLIPGLAYGFTAGASYRGADASLTLGGYDASKFTPNDVSFSFAPTPARQLVVALRSIVYSDSKTKNSPLLPQGILTLVDSTTPQIWLPLAACQSFEKAFGIIYDPIPNLYLVNQTVHNALLQQNASVTFELSNNLNGGPSVQITLPYASFDLQIGPPFANRISNYFPLRRAADDTQYTLGRTFLQESYLIVNYETSNFSVSQMVYGQNTQPHILPILSTNGTTTDSTSSTAGPKQPQVSVSTGNSPQAIGTGAIAGIVIAIVLVTLICGALVFYCRPSRRRRKHSIEMLASPPYPKNMPELADPRFPDTMADKKFVDVTTQETDNPMTPAVEVEGFGLPAQMDRGNHELGGVPRSELDSPEPDERLELPSPDEMPELVSQKRGQRRSGIVSPDPDQIRSRIASAISQSPGTEWSPSGEPSPEAEHVSAALPGPEPFWKDSTIGSRMRPPYHRMDSSEAESASSARRRPVPSPVQERTGSLGSEAGAPLGAFHGRPNSSSSGQWARMQAPRFAHGRLRSQGSNESWETRMEGGEPGPSGAHYGASRAHVMPYQLPPSPGHEEARSAMSTPEVGSTRSALISPGPCHTTFEESRESSLDENRPSK